MGRQRSKLVLTQRHEAGRSPEARAPPGVCFPGSSSPPGCAAPDCEGCAGWASGSGVRTGAASWCWSVEMETATRLSEKRRKLLWQEVGSSSRLNIEMWFINVLCEEKMSKICVMYSSKFLLAGNALTLLNIREEFLLSEFIQNASFISNMQQIPCLTFDQKCVYSPAVSGRSYCQKAFLLHQSTMENRDDAERETMFFYSMWC